MFACVRQDRRAAHARPSDQRSLERQTEHAAALGRGDEEDESGAGPMLLLRLLRLYDDDFLYGSQSVVFRSGTKRTAGAAVI